MAEDHERGIGGQNAFVVHKHDELQQERVRNNQQKHAFHDPQRAEECLNQQQQLLHPQCQEQRRRQT